MGAISAKNADFTIITSDNPRFEEPMSIIKEIEKAILKKYQQYQFDLQGRDWNDICKRFIYLITNEVKV